MYYFAYGSNMSLVRLKERVPSAELLGCCSLRRHDLRFHKISKDGSGKCDAFFTSNREDIIYGALFRIDASEKPNLDKAEGLGYGYTEKLVTVIDDNGNSVEAITYIAAKIDETLRPYSWYVNHVLVGAKETSLPTDYIQEKIRDIGVDEDTDKERDSKERAMYST